MQTIKGFLDKIKEFLEKEMEENHITLPMAPSVGMQGENLKHVQPVVVIGNIPHANFTTAIMDGRFFSAPYIAIGVEECTYDYESEVIPVLIQVCCYTVEAYEDAENEDLSEFNVPDNMGTLDVFNLLENIREWTVKNAPFTIDRPIRMGSYDTKEITYPYSFGYISFDVRTDEGKTRKFDFD